MATPNNENTPADDLLAPAAHSHITPPSMLRDIEGRPIRDRASTKHLDEFAPIAKAWIVCHDVRGRPRRVAVVTLRGELVTADPEYLPTYGSTPTPEPAGVDCRCGVTHILDPDAIRAALDRPHTGRGKVPVLRVHDIERHAPQ